jgi:glutamyl-tRNA reductase
MSHLSKKDQEEVKIVVHRLANKFLHTPTMKLKEVVNQKDGYNYIEALRFLFDLTEKEEKCEE